MPDFLKHNAADAIQCLVEDFDRYLDGSVVPDSDSHECSRDNAILVQETLAVVRELGVAIENGDPQTIANVWLQLKPRVALRKSKMKCFFCFDNGYEVPATRVMPQSVDEENTVEMFACCDGHASDWWDGADWDGRHLEIPLDNQPNTVIFHDRGAGKEFRLFIDGKIILRENADNEVLGSELSEAVEHLIAKGQFSGVTTDPCHPEWTLAYVAP